MTLFNNKVFSVPAPGTDEYRVRYQEVFGEKPSDFCEECGKRESWCECPKESKVEPTDGESG